MAFLTKDEVRAKAAEYGLDLTGLTWPQQQKAVAQAIKDGTPAKATKEPQRVKTIRVQLDKQKHKSVKDYQGKEVLISPEIAARQYQLVKYDEVLGDEIDVEEAHYDGRTLDARGTNLAYGTYLMKGSTGRKVVAQSTLPKQNSRLSFRPGIDLVPVSTFNGRSGYLWTHQRLPNIKQLLLDSGYYNEYRDRFKDEPAIFHSAGKLLCCDINLVHSIFDEIERKESDRRRIYGGNQ